MATYSDIVEEIDADSYVGEAPIKPESPSMSGLLIAKANYFFSEFGWLAVIITAVVLYIAYNMWIRYRKWKVHYDQVSQSKQFDSDVWMQREQGLQAARQRLQSKYDEMADEFKQKQIEKEFEKRQHRIDDFDKPGSSRHRFKGADDLPAGGDKKLPKPSTPKKLNPDYNPLMGARGGSNYRPGRRTCGPSGG